MATNFVANVGDGKYEVTLKESTWRMAMHYETQSIGIHDILNSQEFAMHYRVISSMSDICKFSNVRNSFTAKEMDGLTSFIF